MLVVVTKTRTKIMVMVRRLRPYQELEKLDDSDDGEDSDN